MLVYHIVLPETWAAFKDQEFYEAESLRSEGFIHCSFGDQLAGVLERYYKGVKRVFVMEIDTEKLTSRLANELSTNDEIYPHIYGAINSDAIVNVKVTNLSFDD